MTNFEKLKTMSFYEMLEFLGNVGNCETCSRHGYESCNDVSDCKTHIKEWLEAEAEVS